MTHDEQFLQKFYFARFSTDYILRTQEFGSNISVFLGEKVVSHPLFSQQYRPRSELYGDQKHQTKSPEEIYIQMLIKLIRCCQKVQTSFKNTSESLFYPLISFLLSVLDIINGKKIPYRVAPNTYHASNLLPSVANRDHLRSIKKQVIKK